MWFQWTSQSSSVSSSSSICVGDGVGKFVGLSVGSGVGIGVGKFVGESVGTGVGDGVPVNVVEISAMDRLLIGNLIIYGALVALGSLVDVRSLVALGCFVNVRSLVALKAWDTFGALHALCFLAISPLTETKRSTVGEVYSHLKGISMCKTNSDLGSVNNTYVPEILLLEYIVQQQ